MKTIIAVSIFLLALVANTYGGTTNVTFDWDANPDFAGVKLYQGTVSGGPYTLAKDCAAEKPCVLPNIADGTYFWVARSYDAKGNESVNSNQVTAALDATAPAAPGALKITVTVNVTVP